MWETYGLSDEGLLWAGTAFNAGIAGEQQATCGAVSGSVVSLGLRYRCPPSEKDKGRQARTDARRDASELFRSFVGKFGAVTCRDLLGLDFSKPEAYRKFQESDIWKDKCGKYVQFVVEKLYELDEKRSSGCVC